MVLDAGNLIILLKHNRLPGIFFFVFPCYCFFELPSSKNSSEFVTSHLIEKRFHQQFKCNKARYRITRQAKTKYPPPFCVTLKYIENDCLLNKGIPCLGPLTADGCGSVCPNHNLPCQGCWGPAEGANPTSEFFLLKEKGFDIEAIKKRMSNYSGTKLAEFFEQFKKESK